MNKLQKLADRRIHFVGIGGSGMSGIARIMVSQGLTVSGSDVKSSAITNSLEALGAKIFIGHHPNNIVGVDLLITSGAISKNNPELLIAQSDGIEILSRAEALALLMEGKR